MKYKPGLIITTFVSVKVPIVNWIRFATIIDLPYIPPKTAALDLKLRTANPRYREPSICKIKSKNSDGFTLKSPNSNTEKKSEERPKTFITIALVTIRYLVLNIII